MKIEVRSANPEEMIEARRISAETIVLPPGIIPQGYIDMITHDMTMCAFVDGKMATTYAAWPFYMKFNGMDAPVAGVSFVGTLPVFRRMGCLRKVHSRHFEILHDQGERPISILFASQAAIYQRYGYAVVSKQNSYNIEPGKIKFRSLKHLNGSGRLWQVHQDEVNVLNNIYMQFIKSRTGYLIREKFKWETGVLNPPSAPGVTLDKVVYEENGSPMGYVIYTSESNFTDQGIVQKITIKDMAWLSISAYYGIWNYFTTMDLAHNIHWMQVPSDDPMPYLLLEPNGLNIKSSRGLLARIVDLEKAIPLRGYGEDGELVFSIVDDDMCHWNNGTWYMKVVNGKGYAKKTDKDPEITMDINTLAMILFGQISTTKAMRMGILDVIKENALPRYDRLLKTEYIPFCCDLI